MLLCYFVFCSPVCSGYETESCWKVPSRFLKSFYTTLWCWNRSLIVLALLLYICNLFNILFHKLYLPQINSETICLLHRQFAYYSLLNFKQVNTMAHRFGPRSMKATFPFCFSFAREFSKYPWTSLYWDESTWRDQWGVSQTPFLSHSESYHLSFPFSRPTLLACS